MPDYERLGKSHRGTKARGHPLQFMLHRMKMARSVFYYHMSHMDDRDGYDGIRERIKQIYDRNHGCYGYRRICMELRNEDIVINHKTVRKLMNQMGLKAKTRKRRYRSYKGEVGRIAPNVLERDFSADRPNQKWATDVTQVCINDRKLYLSSISPTHTARGRREASRMPTSSSEGTSPRKPTSAA